jgi:uncharacterized protein (TIGR02284 family)
MADERPTRTAGASTAAVQHDVPTLNELILVAREGCEFYTSAAEKVGSDRLRELFHEMAAARSRLAADLELHVQATGERPVEPTRFGTTLRRLYVDLLARTADDRDAAYVAQLEEVEDGLLQAFEDAVAEAQVPEIKAVLQHHLPRVRANHDRVRAMKQTQH